MLTPKGDVVDLPEGATPIDFAYNIHSEIGDRMSGAKVNGRIVPFSHQLSSGDIVEVITQKNKKPSSEWLNLSKTSLAKSHIRASLKESGYLPGKRPQKPENKTEIVVTVKDRVGLLKDISGVFSSVNINIQNIQVKRDSGYPKIYIVFSPKNTEQLQKIKMKLKAVKNVEQVSSHFKP